MSTSATEHRPAPTPTWTPRLIFSLTSIVLLLEVLAVSYIMISLALSDITGHFKTTQGAWMLTAFLLVGAVASPLVGKLADMYGKRKLLLACGFGSGLGALVCAIAPSYGVLIGGRALMGLLSPCVFLSYSLIRDTFPKGTVALAVSITTSGLGLLSIPSPFLAGFFLDNFGWRSIFWFFMVGLLVFSAMIAVSTEESTLRVRSKLDLVGASLLGGGVAGILIAVSFGPAWGWTTGSTLAYLFGGLALIVAWLVSSKMIREPLIELNVLKNRPVFLITIGAGFCYATSALFAVLIAMMTMTPEVLGLGYGFGVTAEGAAVFQAPIGLMIMVGGLIVGILVGRRSVRPRILLVGGMLLVALSYALAAAVHDNEILLVIFAGIFGTGIGLGYASIPNLLIEAVPPQLQASTASIVGVSQNVFAAILPVIAFTVMNNSYIADLPIEMTGGATLYTDKGFQVAFLIGAVVSVIGALAAFMLPRKIHQLAGPPAIVVSKEEPVTSGH